MYNIYFKVKKLTNALRVTQIRTRPTPYYPKSQFQLLLLDLDVHFYWYFQKSLESNTAYLQKLVLVIKQMMLHGTTFLIIDFGMVLKARA